MEPYHKGDPSMVSRALLETLDDICPPSDEFSQQSVMVRINKIRMKTQLIHVG